MKYKIINKIVMNVGEVYKLHKIIAVLECKIVRYWCGDYCELTLLVEVDE